MSARERNWLFVVLTIGFIAFFVPYVLLNDVNKWYGSFLLWILVGLAAIVINIFITKDWGR